MKQEKTVAQRTKTTQQSSSCLLVTTHCGGTDGPRPSVGNQAPSSRRTPVMVKVCHALGITAPRKKNQRPCRCEFQPRPKQSSFLRSFRRIHSLTFQPRIPALTPPIHPHHGTHVYRQQPQWAAGVLASAALLPPWPICTSTRGPSLTRCGRSEAMRVPCASQASTLTSGNCLPWSTRQSNVRCCFSGLLGACIRL